MRKLSKDEKAQRYERLMEKQRRNRVKIILLARKATEAGITVSNSEIDEYLKGK